MDDIISLFNTAINSSDVNIFQSLASQFNELALNLHQQYTDNANKTNNNSHNNNQQIFNKIIELLQLFVDKLTPESIELIGWDILDSCLLFLLLDDYNNTNNNNEYINKINSISYQLLDSICAIGVAREIFLSLLANIQAATDINKQLLLLIKLLAKLINREKINRQVDMYNQALPTLIQLLQQFIQDIQDNHAANINDNVSSQVVLSELESKLHMDYLQSLIQFSNSIANEIKLNNRNLILSFYLSLLSQIIEYHYNGNNTINDNNVLSLLNQINNCKINLAEIHNYYVNRDKLENEMKSIINSSWDNSINDNEDVDKLIDTNNADTLFTNPKIVAIQEKLSTLPNFSKEGITAYIFAQTLFNNLHNKSNNTGNNTLDNKIAEHINICDYNSNQQFSILFPFLFSSFEWNVPYAADFLNNTLLSYIPNNQLNFDSETLIQHTNDDSEDSKLIPVAISNLTLQYNPTIQLISNQTFQLIQYIINNIMQQSNQTKQQNLLKLLNLFINKYTTTSRFQLLKKIILQCPYPSIAALLIQNIKQEILNSSNKPDKCDNNPFVGNELMSLLFNILTKDNLDILTAVLNIFRFIILRDKNIIKNSKDTNNTNNMRPILDSDNLNRLREEMGKLLIVSKSEDRAIEQELNSLTLSNNNNNSAANNNEDISQLQLIRSQNQLLTDLINRVNELIADF